METLKILFLFLVMVGFKIQAEEYMVVDVKRNITLSDDDNVYKDFYINAGEGSSLKKNLVVKVKRRIQVKESPTKNVGDFDAVVGQLKIIQVGNKVSVAREFKLTPRDEEPMLEQIGIMSGDRVDLTGSFVDYTKPNYKHKTSENDSPKKEEQPIKTASADEPATASNVDGHATNSVVTTTTATQAATQTATQVTTTQTASVVPAVVTPATPAPATTTTVAPVPTAPAQSQATPPAQENVNVRKPASVEPTLLQKIIPMPGSPGNNPGN